MMMKPTHVVKKTTILDLRKIMEKVVICGRDLIVDLRWETRRARGPGLLEEVQEAQGDQELDNVFKNNKNKTKFKPLKNLNKTVS